MRKSKWISYNTLKQDLKYWIQYQYQLTIYSIKIGKIEHIVTEILDIPTISS